ncbi:benzoate carboxyl methyltransferase-like isoform X2 [Andrographis paniculata]|uniref:benzoate carboxyl methyltransferase-like isoform X2 n=1 Tax=Andrographis paniculata TaxID=175694 RepID=UPI0021E72381|nr:benzoate carboxyl methyltransferase-like isoform X2 [Andrographis paniculata]
MEGVDVVNVLHMNVGNGAFSYANNSLNPRIGIMKTWHLLEEVLKKMSLDPGFSKCFTMADLGCSSGPNTLLVISRVIEIIRGLCDSDRDNIEFQVFLNDLPGTPRCIVLALPGSFYGRLFPRGSLNFVWSSYSLQWLSQVPKGLASNKSNISISMTSPQEVIDAYKKQYQRDFMTFLMSRSEEMMSGGYMILTIVGRSIEDSLLHDDYMQFTILADTFVEMINEGTVKEADLYSFNIPLYKPSTQEVEELIKIEGSFNLEKVEGFKVHWDAHVRYDYGNRYDEVDKYKLGQKVSNFIRAYTEPIVAKHFGNTIMDDLYKRYEKKLAEYLSREDPMYFITTVCLSRKTKK